MVSDKDPVGWLDQATKEKIRTTVVGDSPALQAAGLEIGGGRLCKI